MNLPPEIVEKIISYLPVQTYNEVFGTHRPVGLYDTIPERIVLQIPYVIHSVITRWHFPGASTVEIYDAEELRFMHQSPPFLPSKRIILELNGDFFLRLQKECPELLQQYKIHFDTGYRPVKPPKEFPYPYEIEYYALTLPYVTDATTHLAVKPGPDMVVAHESVSRICLFCDPFYTYDSDSEAEEEEASGFEFNCLDSWNVPKLSCLDIKDPGPNLKHFRYHDALDKLKLDRVLVEDLPDFPSFNLKALSLVMQGRGTLNFSLPATLSSLSIRRTFNNPDPVVLGADFTFPEKLTTLTLLHTVLVPELPRTLTSLCITYHSLETTTADFTKLSSLEKLKLQTQYTEVKLPPSLKALNLENCKVENLQELVQLEDLGLEYRGVADELVLPPKVIKCKLSGYDRIHKLKLNSTLQILHCSSQIETPLTLPETLRLLKLQSYKPPLELPEGLEQLELRNYFTTVETPKHLPKHLKYLMVVNYSDELPALECKLNDQLKMLSLARFNIDLVETPFPSGLEYLVLCECRFDDPLVGMYDLDRCQVCDNHIFRRYSLDGPLQGPRCSWATL